MRIGLNPGDSTPGGGGLVDSKCDFAFWRQPFWCKLASIRVILRRVAVVWLTPNAILHFGGNRFGANWPESGWFYTGWRGFG